LKSSTATAYIDNRDTICVILPDSAFSVLRNVFFQLVRSVVLLLFVKLVL